MESTSFPPATSPYWIDSPLEVQHLFRTLARKSAKVTLWLSGTEFAPSMVLAVLPNGDLVLDVDVDPRVNQKMLAARMVIVSGNVDKVPVKCQLEDLQLTLYQGAQAFIARAPRRIHKLQRREFYRVNIPATRALHCHFDLNLPPAFSKAAPTVHKTKSRVLDLSLGGLCLEAQVPAGYTPTTQTEVRNCRFELPDEAPISFDLLFCHVSTTQDRRGQVSHKVGGQFKGMPSADQKRLNGFLMQLEREQRMLNE